MDKEFNDFLKKTRIFFKKNILSLILVIILTHIYFNYLSKDLKKEEDISLSLKAENILSGIDENIENQINNIELNQIDTKSNFEIFQNYAKNHYRFFNPALQPILNASNYSYSERSNILTDYLKENTKTLNNIWNINSGYLFIKFTQKPTGKVFLYFHNWKFSNWRKASWNLDITKSLEYVSDRSYIFRLNSIPIERYSDKKLEYYDRQKDINTKEPQYIWWFVSQFDWTSIEEIIIARE